VVRSEPFQVRTAPGTKPEQVTLRTTLPLPRRGRGWRDRRERRDGVGRGPVRENEGPAHQEELAGARGAIAERAAAAGMPGEAVASRAQQILSLRRAGGTAPMPILHTRETPKTRKDPVPATRKTCMH